jgi:hypothetical protein
MLGALRDVTQVEHEESVKFTRNRKALVLRKHYGKDVAEVAELMKIRHFLQRSSPAPERSAAGTHLLVVIDHRLARVYKSELHGAVPARIIPWDPDGSGRHLHRVDDDSNGQRKPERKTFYEAVAKTLQGAEKILLFGSATGASSAMNHLLDELKRNHKDVAQRVVGSVVTDWQNRSDDQLLAKARDFYAGRAV